MERIMKRIGLYLFCVLCVMCFACCAQPDATGSSTPQNTASDSVLDDSGSQNSGSSDSSDDTQDSGSSDSSDDTQDSSTDSSDNTQEDENELPRVPYGAE